MPQLPWPSRRLSVPHRFLMGLRTYCTSDSIPQAMLARASGLSSKQGNKKSAPPTPLGGDLGGAESLLIIPLAYRDIEGAEFFNYFSNLVSRYACRWS